MFFPFLQSHAKIIYPLVIKHGLLENPPFSSMNFLFKTSIYKGAPMTIIKHHQTSSPSSAATAASINNKGMSQNWRLGGPQILVMLDNLNPSILMFVPNLKPGEKMGVNMGQHGLCRPRLTATAGGRLPLFTAVLVGDIDGWIMDIRFILIHENISV